jgi:hypothetical protein
MKIKILYDPFCIASIDSDRLIEIVRWYLSVELTRKVLQAQGEGTCRTAPVKSSVSVLAGLDYRT